jgi:hypothetical protein
MYDRRKLSMALRYFLNYSTAVICVHLTLIGLAHAELVVVPDTLDLGKRAAFALNALNGTSDERGEFMFRCSIVPPDVKHDAFSFSACGPKYIESMAMMSLMTGKSLEETGCQRAVDYLVSCLGDDGLFYCKIGPDRPWDTTSPEDWANIYGQGRMLRAMLAMEQLDGNSAWFDRMRKLVAKLKEIAVRKTDAKTGERYAYFPTTPGYGDIFSYPKSGWKTTELLTDADKSSIGSHIADLPDHSFGIPLYIGGVVAPLVQYAEAHDDPEALQLAGELVHFLLKKESAWIPDGHAQGVIPEQRGQFYGHFHGHTMALRGILEYAIATNDPRLKDFVRSGYEYARAFGIPRLGWFQEYTGKASHETCGLANMTALAIKLSNAGVGDYWDDVDCYVRNHLTEAQFINLQRLQAANTGKELSEKEQQTLRRLIGTFAGWGTPESLDDTRIMNCCTANGSQALYYVWDSMVRDQDDTTYVNLLLNRRTLKVDVVSWVPFRGQVDFFVKKKGRLAVRIPGWVDMKAVTLEHNGSIAPITSIDRYVWLDEVAPGDEVTLTFPMAESTETYAVDSYEFRGKKYYGRQNYTVRFFGNTAVHIEPHATSGYATYNDRKYHDRELQLVPVDPYVTGKRINW